MNSLNTLLFPGTTIHSIRQFPLFLLLRKIHILQPVEDEPDTASAEPSDNFIKSGFCQVHTPCPLGESRKRFQHLVQDISTRKDDYAAQLSALTLATLSDSDENTLSEREIISSIKTPTQHTIEVKKEIEKEERLWQARLVLAIGEILDREEEEIALNLARLEDDETSLFQELHGESNISDTEENPFAEVSQMKENLRVLHPGSVKNRCKAWTILFSESSQQNPDILLTTIPESVDLLLDEYEKISGNSALKIATLPLPGFIGWEREKACNTALDFHAKYGTLITELETEFSTVKNNKERTEQDIKNGCLSASLSKSWESALEQEFPKEQHGRIAAKIYLFPQTSCSTLLLNSPPIPDSNAIVIVVG